MTLEALLPMEAMERQIGVFLERADDVLRRQEDTAGPHWGAGSSPESHDFEELLADALIFMVEQFRGERTARSLVSADPDLRKHVDRHNEVKADLSAELMSIVANLSAVGVRVSVLRFQELLRAYLEYFSNRRKP